MPPLQTGGFSLQLHSTVLCYIYYYSHTTNGHNYTISTIFLACTFQAPMTFSITKYSPLTYVPFWWQCFVVYNAFLIYLFFAACIEEIAYSLFIHIPVLIVRTTFSSCFTCTTTTLSSFLASSYYFFAFTS